VKNVPIDYDECIVIMQQTIRYMMTRDQVRLAWASSGTGPAMVKASNWITHLEYDWESPVLRHWVQFLSEHFSLTRYDERGCGLTQRDVDDVSPVHWINDLEDVINVAQPQPPFVLMGISQGACAAVEYAVKYPERVSQLILYGGYARGWTRHSNPDHVREGKALVELIELGWGRSDPIYRRLLTKKFLPEGNEEQLLWFDELCSRSISPKMAARLLLSRGEADVSDLLPLLKVPTLVAHASGDLIAPISQGQQLAAGIPGAQFVQLDSPNHIMLEHEPAWQRFCAAVLDFTGVRSQAEEAVFKSLSSREREILGKLVFGLTNVEIGQALFISEKTVRNQLTRIFEKLGVSNRSQAIVHARDHGFRVADQSQ
jgi:pimeloyl-ACP methyl ester carboxylesterase/DNA-binding CsgD family transcriptional regulator